LLMCPYSVTHPLLHSPPLFLFFFNATPTTEIYTLSLHDALPICFAPQLGQLPPNSPKELSIEYRKLSDGLAKHPYPIVKLFASRSEEHTSELQSRENLVCRLLLEKKKKKKKVSKRE